MKFCSLASGSTGNCYYIGHEQGGVLIDAGISAKAIGQALDQALQVEPSSLAGILVTHEHVDHIKSVGTMARRYHLPIYASAGTWQGMAGKIGLIAPELQKVLPAEGKLNLGEMAISWFEISHDSEQPVSFLLEHQEKKIGIATDTGVLNDGIIDKLYNSDLIIMEANHDEEMVRNGRYPYFLKQRILSDQGHLSNKACAAGLQRMIGGKTNHVVLAHLSQENNYPNLAHQTVKEILLKGKLTGRLNLWVAKAQVSSVLLEI